MADFIFKISPNIVLGSYASSRVGQFVREWGSRYMVLVDPVLSEFGIAEKIEESLRTRNIDFFMYDEIPSAPDTTVIQQALNLGREAHIHGIITVGGTKVASIGRAVAALFYESHDIYDYIEGEQPTSEALPVICVPTTICDPFLFCDRTPIIDARSRQIKMLKIQSGLCRLAIFDPNLTVSFTENQHATMALQALCIAIEAYISQKASFFSDTIIEKAVELLSYTLNSTPPLTASVPKETLALQGGCLASLGAATSSIGVASIIGFSINARYKISRASTSTVLLPHIIEDGAKCKTERLAKIARLLNVAADPSSDEEAVSALIENIRNKIAMSNLPARLKDLPISMEQLALAAEDAGQLEHMTTLPRSMTADDLFDIMKQAF